MYQLTFSGSLAARKNNDKIEPARDPDGKQQKVSEVWKDFDKFIDKENKV